MTELVPVAKLIRDGIIWKNCPMESNDRKSSGYIGVSANNDWRFVVASWSIEEDGFPKGSMGYDGTATAGGTIIHLPAPQAKMLCEDAEEKLNT